MHDLRQELAVLRSMVETGFANERRIFEVHRGEQTERHEENRARLERIEKQVTDTNGRVTRHDEQIRTLFRRHGRDKDGADAPLTLSMAARYLLIASACISATYWVLVVLLGFKR